MRNDSSLPEIPEAELRAAYAMTNPPRFIGIEVVVGGMAIAVISLETFRAAAARLIELEKKSP